MLRTAMSAVLRTAVMSLLALGACAHPPARRPGRVVIVVPCVLFCTVKIDAKVEEVTRDDPTPIVTE